MTYTDMELKVILLVSKFKDWKKIWKEMKQDN